jgi:cation diffusion facilitator CzcD-associated flavoprotein CzcO
MPDRSRYALIGAGPAGLAVARALLARGIAYDQFEADRDVGGNWLHGVYETAHIISSKKTTEYPDFPMPASYPDFPSAAQMLAYLRSYADHFALRPHIRFNTAVARVAPRADAHWDVTTADGTISTYTGVIVCNGHHWARRMPDIPGTFAGETIHSKDYRRPEQLRDKRVLVIGAGNSACDVAAEAARTARSSDISIRRGYWFLPKTIFGVPLPEVSPLWLPVWAQRLFLRATLRVIVGKYAAYGLPEPEMRIFETHPTINSELLHYLKHGRIRARPEVARFEGHTAHFTDGTHADYDLVVCATGFNVAFPFLPDGLVRVRHGQIPEVYGGTMLADYKGLYLVGWGQARYGIGPLITPGAEVLCDIIRMQEESALPLGLVLREMGEAIPDTHLMNPGETLRKMKRARLLLPLVRRKARALERTVRWSPAPLPDAPAPSVADPLVGAASGSHPHQFY